MFIHLKSIDSTNNYIEKNHFPPGTVVWADTQTAGRGRGDHEFSSPPGGIYFSCLFKEGKETEKGYLLPHDALLLTPKAAVAVCSSLEEICSIKPGIKWVNDILLDGKKVCGILCEHIKDKYIVGIGINTSASTLPEELKATAGGIGEAPRKTLVKSIAKKLFDPMDDETIVSEYSKRLDTLGKNVSFIYDGKETTGTVTGINESCNLTIRAGSATVTLSSGEIRVI
ncbi:MAG: biotin--[acetyl-CoA-carboxylase] ligase [Firmicutes bacterium]|nr:biotin--[acetyl-CoA-carboxylase] ligase [Bacillota bacterium]